MGPSLVEVREWITRYIMSIFLVLGLLGNAINIFIFTRKNPLRNSCSLYLLSISTMNLIILSWGIIPQLYTLNNADPSTYSFIYCKLRLYILHTLLMMGRSLTILACIDRYALCSNSVLIRSFSQSKVAIRLIIGVLLVWPVLDIHLPISMSYTEGGCLMVAPYSLIWAIYSVIVPGLLTPTLMGSFSVSAMLHRRQLQTRLNRRSGTSNKRNYTLMMMLFSEVFVYVVSTSLFPIITLYRAATNGEMKSVQSQQIEAFLYYLGTSLLIYISPSSGFYIYVVTSRNYRKKCKRALLRLYMRVTGQMAQIRPATVLRENTIQHRTARF